MPKRVNLAIMLFMACLLSYMMRVNLSINIIAMVDNSSNDNGTTEVLPDVSFMIFLRGKAKSFIRENNKVTLLIKP